MAFGNRARDLDTRYGRLLRGAVIAVVTLGSFLIAWDQFHTPAVAPASAPAAEFSAERAMAHVEAFAVGPRPQGSEAAAAGRDYIIEQLEALGLSPEVQTTTAARTTEGTDAIFGATVVNVMARISGSGDGRAIVLSGHYDSGPNATGAGDCGSCVATVLETARALLAGPPLQNDVILLFPDGEETQLFGSRAFVQEHPWAADVGFALNLESQGSSGPAVFYVSSDNDREVAARVIEYAQQPTTWSFLSTLVRNLVGGSDLDNFMDADTPGAGVAFFDDEQYYHTRLDDGERLDPRSVQHMGDYALRVTRGLGDVDLAMLGADADGVYLTLWRGTVLQYSSQLALVLALLATIGLGGALFVGRRLDLLSLRRVAAASGLFVAALLAAVVLTTLIWVLVRITNTDYHVFLIGVTYQADSFVLAFTLLTVALFLGTWVWARPHFTWVEFAGGSLVIWGLFTMLTAVLLPSFSPLFTWPLLVALAVVSFAIVRPAIADAPWARTVGFALVVIVTMLTIVPALLLFQTLAGRMEALTGMPMMGLPILWAALGAGLLVPFVPRPPVRRAWLLPATLAIAAAVLIGWTSATSGFDADHPKPNLIIYELNADTGSAQWLTTGDAALGRGRGGQLDEWTSQFLVEPEETAVAAWSAGPDFTSPGYRADAPVADLDAPQVEVLGDDAEGGVRRLTLHVSSPRGALNLRMQIHGQITAASIDGVEANVAELDVSDGVWLYYYALPMEGIEVRLSLDSTERLTLEVHDWSQGLPEFDGAYEPRGEHMMPSAHDLADTTIVTTTYVIE